MKDRRAHLDSGVRAVYYFSSSGSIPSCRAKEPAEKNSDLILLCCLCGPTRGGMLIEQHSTSMWRARRAALDGLHQSRRCAHLRPSQQHSSGRATQAGGRGDLSRAPHLMRHHNMPTSLLPHGPSRRAGAAPTNRHPRPLAASQHAKPTDNRQGMQNITNS
jgi:hypothetical protein